MALKENFSGYVIATPPASHFEDAKLILNSKFLLIYGWNPSGFMDSNLDNGSIVPPPRLVNVSSTQGVQANIQSDMLGVSAGNMFASASAVSPFLNMSSTLMTGAGGVIGQIASSKHWSK